ncbi:hypothetical protein QFC21_002479 [Naganishia friedmannii]|uniref:Uncharacterized protein n=1 Tax=Naganishia friedmannii TaxID=89922 RepID=A0ACC2VUP9_9TREE|nr:hypothetical protein QFC21_002479 [Naganishia friedmannii]
MTGSKEEFTFVKIGQPTLRNDNSEQAKWPQRKPMSDSRHLSPHEALKCGLESLGSALRGTRAALASMKAYREEQKHRKRDLQLVQVRLDALESLIESYETLVQRIDNATNTAEDWNRYIKDIYSYLSTSESSMGKPGQYKNSKAEQWTVLVDRLRDCLVQVANGRQEVREHPLDTSKPCETFDSITQSSISGSHRAIGLEDGENTV